MRFSLVMAALAASSFVVPSVPAAAAQMGSPLILNSEGRIAHIFPTYNLAKQLGMLATPGAPPVPLTYHGGPIMQPFLHLYVVFWKPATLQDGSAAVMSSGYESVQGNMVKGYPGHAIAAIGTQYYQNSPRLFVTGTGQLEKSIVDSQPYPTSGCASAIGPNCITDAQLRTEVQRFMTSKGYTGGLDKLFMFFTASGEGSCFDTGTDFCSTETANVDPYYCAYHSYISAATPIVFSNEPYGNPNFCLGTGTQPNSALGGPEADPASTAASHEMSESMTDPELSAWYDSSGNENGDKCAYNYGSNSWGGVANQYWLGWKFELQMEWSNHHQRCEAVGP
jgi:hypothetical protein